MQPLFWDPMQIFPQRKHVLFSWAGQGLKSLLASTKLVPAPRVKDAAEKLLAKLQRNETAVGAPAQAQERWGWDGMGRWFQKVGVCKALYSTRQQKDTRNIHNRGLNY